MNKRLFHIAINMVMILFYAVFLYSHFIFYNYSRTLTTLLFIISESLIIILFLIRKYPKQTSTDPFDWTVAFVGTFLPTLFRPYALHDVVTGQILIVIGIILQMFTLLSLNRSFGIVPANRDIKTRGMYSLVRHPMYTSYTIVYLGYTFNNPTLINISIFILCTLFQLIRIRNEEKFLLADSKYKTYSEKIKWKLIPYIFFGLCMFTGSLTYAHEIGAPNTTVIHIEENAFNPAEIEIKAGDTVIFENTSKKENWPASNLHPTHTAYPGSDIEICNTPEQKNIFDACHGLKNGETFSFTFTHDGIWRYHDHLHPNLTGKIIVSSTGEQFIERATSTNSTLSSVLKSFYEKIKNKLLYVTLSPQSKKIFTENAALEAYVRKFGTANTINHLSSLKTDFGDCHQQAHRAGRIGYQLFGAKVFEECKPECLSGCYHGAIEAFFSEKGTTNIKENVSTACSSYTLLRFGKEQCYHGIGHGLMAWNDYKLPDTLKDCDLLEENQRRDCYEGVFMENIVGGISKDTLSVNPEKSDMHFTDYLSSDPLYPCTIVGEKYKIPCYFMQTSRMLQLYGRDFEKISSICLTLKSDYQGACFESMGRDAAAGYITDRTPAIKECDFAPNPGLHERCIDGIIKAIFWDAGEREEALKICKTLTEKDGKKACYKALIARAINILVSDESYKLFCSTIESDYQKQCLEARKL